MDTCYIHIHLRDRLTQQKKAAEQHRLHRSASKIRVYPGAFTAPYISEPLLLHLSWSRYCSVYLGAITAPLASL